MLQDQILNFIIIIFILLELNTQPGMTSLSLVPEIANFKGLTFENLVEKILIRCKYLIDEKTYYNCTYIIILLTTITSQKIIISKFN